MASNQCIPTIPVLTTPPIWGWQGWYLLADLFVLFIILFTNYVPIEFALVGSGLMLFPPLIISTTDLLSGYSNPGILAVTQLFIIAEALASTGAIDYYMQKLLGHPKTSGAALTRMMIPSTFVAAFISSTTVVAIFTPILLRWCRQNKIAPSIVFMPLCFAVHLGGTCTLIGTTTNLVISGLATSYYCQNIGIFELVPVGLPAALAGCGLMVLISPRVLPDQAEYDRRTKFAASHQAIKKNKQNFLIGSIYKCFGIVPKLDSDETNPDAPLINVVDEGFEIDREANNADFIFHALNPLSSPPLTVEEKGLRNLNGLFLIAVQRANTRFAAVGPSFVIVGGDLLSFAGTSTNFIQFCSSKNLEAVIVDEEEGSQESTSAATPIHTNPVSSFTVQAIVRSGSSLIGITPRDANFRTKYNASIIAIHRAGEKLTATRLGQVPLKVGDVLAMVTGDKFDWNVEPTVSDLKPRRQQAPNSKYVGQGATSEGDALAVDAFSVGLEQGPPLKNEEAGEESQQQDGNSRDFAFALRITDKVKDLILVPTLVGLTLEKSGLRHIPGVKVVALERDGVVERAVGPDIVLNANDVVWFVGDRDGLSATRRVPGLEEIEVNHIDRLKIAPQHRRLLEVVLSLQSDLLYKTVRESRFRTRFGAAIVGIQRRDCKLVTKFGDVVLQPGDVLMLDTGPDFIGRFKDDPNFLLITEIEGSTPPRFDRFYIALLITLGMIVVAAVVNTPQGPIELVVPAAFAVALMLSFGVTNRKRAHAAIDWKIIVTIASAFALAAGMVNTQVAAIIGKALTDLAVLTGTGEIGLLAAILICTEVLASLITAKAAAVIMFPIAANSAARLQIDTTLMLITLMVGANTFLTPQGHQTNLMVMGPGAYKFADYQKLGWPVMLFINVVQLVCLKFYQQYYITIPLAILFFVSCVIFDHACVSKLRLRDLYMYRVPMLGVSYVMRKLGWKLLLAKESENWVNHAHINGSTAKTPTSVVAENIVHHRLNTSPNSAASGTEMVNLV